MPWYFSHRVGGGEKSYSRPIKNSTFLLCCCHSVSLARGCNKPISSSSSTGSTPASMILIRKNEKKRFQQHQAVHWCHFNLGGNHSLLTLNRFRPRLGPPWMSTIWVTAGINTTIQVPLAGLVHAVVPRGLASASFLLFQMRNLNNLLGDHTDLIHRCYHAV